MSDVPTLSVRGVGKSFGARRVAEGISFDIAAGEVVCLLGPSGSGKSTVLRILAGVERADAGEVIVSGVTVEGPRRFVPPEKRQVGLVFQDLALFPHLTARANATFGLFRQSKAEAARRADLLLAMVGLTSHAAAFPHQLSGGEQQRLAVARALAPRPKVMLLDEPFSGLDDRLREDVRRDVLKVLKTEGAATLFVTHDPDEALRSADRIVLLRQGRMAQTGTPNDLWSRPADLGVAGFFSPISQLSGLARNGRIETLLGSVIAPPNLEDVAVVATRPRDLEIAPEGVALVPMTVSLASDGLHVRFAPCAGLPEGVAGVFHADSNIQAGVPVTVRLRVGHGFVFPAAAA